MNFGQGVEPCGEFPACFAFEKAEIELFPDVVREIGDFAVASHSGNCRMRSVAMFAHCLYTLALVLSRETAICRRKWLPRRAFAQSVRIAPFAGVAELHSEANAGWTPLNPTVARMEARFPRSLNAFRPAVDGGVWLQLAKLQSAFARKVSRRHPALRTGSRDSGTTCICSSFPS